MAGLAGTILTILDYPPLVGPTNPLTTQHLTVSSEPRDKLATQQTLPTQQQLVLEHVQPVEQRVQ